jgi:DNA-binding Lrp family transcriptional regulator
VKNARVKEGITVDELDLQIIEELNLNGRAPFGAIAEKIGTSVDSYQEIPEAQTD